MKTEEEKLIEKEQAQMFLDMRALFLDFQSSVYCDNFDDRKYLLEKGKEIYFSWKNKIVDEWDKDVKVPNCTR